MSSVGQLVRSLSVSQLLPPTVLVPGGMALGKLEEEYETESQEGGVQEEEGEGPTLPPEIDMKMAPNHLDWSQVSIDIAFAVLKDSAVQVLPAMPGLEDLSICYQVKNCGTDFRWNMFGLTDKVYTRV